MSGTLLIFGWQYETDVQMSSANSIRWLKGRLIQLHDPLLALHGNMQLLLLYSIFSLACTAYSEPIELGQPQAAQPSIFLWKIKRVVPFRG